MNVKELIDRLKVCNPNAQVTASLGDDRGAVLYGAVDGLSAGDKDICVKAFTEKRLDDLHEADLFEDEDEETDEEEGESGEYSGDKVATDEKHEIENAIVFPHQFDGLQAVWGYSLAYDEEGLLIREARSGAEFDWFVTDDLLRALERFGAYGIHGLIFQSSTWQQIPALAGEFATIYETWGC